MPGSLEQVGQAAGELPVAGGEATLAVEDHDGQRLIRLVGPGLAEDLRRAEDSRHRGSGKRRPASAASLVRLGARVPTAIARINQAPTTHPGRRLTIERQESKSINEISVGETFALRDTGGGRNPCVGSIREEPGGERTWQVEIPSRSGAAARDVAARIKGEQRLVTLRSWQSSTCVTSTHGRVFGHPPKCPASPQLETPNPLIANGSANQRPRGFADSAA